MRKGYTKLTLQDFEEHPVWELQGSLTFAEPYKGKIPFKTDKSRAYFVSTSFELADKTKMKGWVMICVPPYEAASLHPTILTSHGKVELTKIASKPKAKEVDGAYQRLGKKSHQVFPLRFETEVAIPKGTAKGEIRGFIHRLAYKDDNGWPQHIDFCYQTSGDLESAIKKYQQEEKVKKAALEPSNDEKALLRASKIGDAKKVAAFIAKKVNANRGGMLEEGGYTRKQVTPLMLAAEAGHKEVIQILLEAGANIHLEEETNEPRQNNRTALACACRKNQLETARVLLESGADPNHKLSFGHSILDEACSESSVELIALLLRSGGNPNSSEGKSDYFALERAVAANRLDVVELLLDNGADISMVGENEETALMKAAQLRRTDIVCYLLKRGAAVNQKGYGGATALYHLCWPARHIHPGLDSDAAESIRSVLEIAKLLIEHGANVNASTKHGDSPLTLAKQCKFPSLSELLEAAGRKK